MVTYHIGHWIKAGVHLGNCNPVILLSMLFYNFVQGFFKPDFFFWMFLKGIKKLLKWGVLECNHVAVCNSCAYNIFFFRTRYIIKIWKLFASNDFYLNSALQINIIPLPVTMNRKIKKPTSQIKLSAVTIKQQIKLLLQHSLCKWI